MDLDMAMHILSQEQLMHTISQLDSALANLPSPSASPPQPPLVLVPSNQLCTITIPPAQMPAVLPPAAANLELTATRNVLYCAAAAATRPLVVTIDAEADADAARPRRRNVHVSSEPQSVAARLRRERVSERMRALQRLVPGGARLDTASMLDEAIRYVRFLKGHVRALEKAFAAAMHGRVVGDDDVAGAGDLYSCPYYA